jgi:hypothetical protein
MLKDNENPKLVLSTTIVKKNVTVSPQPLRLIFYF